MGYETQQMHRTVRRKQGTMSTWRLYEIDKLLRDAVARAPLNEETGEIPDDWASFLDNVQMDRDHKALSVAAMVRELTAEAEAVKAEKNRLADRQKSAEAKADRLKSYLSTFVNVGEKLSDARVSIGWRKSEKVIVRNAASIPDAYCKIERTVSLSALKDAIKSGEYTGPDAAIAVNNNIQIK